MKKVFILIISFLFWFCFNCFGLELTFSPIIAIPSKINLEYNNIKAGLKTTDFVGLQLEVVKEFGKLFSFGAGGIYNTYMLNDEQNLFEAGQTFFRQNSLYFLMHINFRSTKKGNNYFADEKCSYIVMKCGVPVVEVPGNTCLSYYSKIDNIHYKNGYYYAVGVGTKQNNVTGEVLYNMWHYKFNGKDKTGNSEEITAWMPVITISIGLGFNF